ncbi:hypothetical protein [Nonomuraea sp. bgisy101]|uniref:hypothetical protein n=1 Tax=Nonomuraea sp. bgisy101 TaxID=3413784 RepID=UPI003D7218BF
MRLPHALSLLAAAAVGTSGLLATPVHAAPIPVPVPVYGCYDIQRDEAAAVVTGVWCESYGGAPVTGEIVTEFRIVPNDPEGSASYTCRLPAGKTAAGYAGGYPAAVLGFSCWEETAEPAVQAPAPATQTRDSLRPHLLLDPIRLSIR